MSTDRQKAAARRNLEKARAAKTARRNGAQLPRSPGLSTAKENTLDSSQFAFPKQRKEPLTDAGHVRNAVARFDQVEKVSDADRDEAWKHIKSAAQRFHVEIEAKSWRDLFVGGKEKKR